MIETIYSGFLFLMLLAFGIMIGLIAGALTLCLFYLVCTSCWSIVSVFIPKNYRKGGRFNRQ